MRQFKNIIYCRRLVPESDSPILDYILNAALTEIKRDFLLLVEEHHGIKGWVSVRNMYHSVKTQEEFENTLQSKNYIMTNEFETDEILHQIKEQLISRNSELTRGRSDLQLIRTLDLTIKVVRWAPISGGYFLKLPPFLQNKHSIINVNSTDNRCFGYALASYFLYQESIEKLGPNIDVPDVDAESEPTNQGSTPSSLNGPTKNPSRKLKKSAQIPERINNSCSASTYSKHFYRLKINNLPYPVDPCRVPEIEDFLKIKINLFSFFDDEGRGRYPFYISKKTFEKEVDLLYWSGHYAYIKNFSGFLADIHKSKHTRFFCKNCFGHFKNQQALDNHKLFCQRPNFSDQIYLMPEVGSRLYFKNKRHEYTTPFVIYADIECLTTKIDDHTTASTTRYQAQLPCSIGYKLVSRARGYPDKPLVLYTGQDCISRFMKDLLEMETELSEFIFNPARVDMEEYKDREDLINAKQCFLCHKDFTYDPGMGRTAVPDYSTASYRGCAHEKCALNEKSKFRIPVFFHNFIGYDGHLNIMGVGSQ